MNYLFSAVVFSAAAENVRDIDETLDGPPAEPNTNETIVAQDEPKRKLPYLKNSRLRN